MKPRKGITLSCRSQSIIEIIDSGIYVSLAVELYFNDIFNFLPASQETNKMHKLFYSYCGTFT